MIISFHFEVHCGGGKNDNWSTEQPGNRAQKPQKEKKEKIKWKGEKRPVDQLAACQRKKVQKVNFKTK